MQAFDSQDEVDLPSERWLTPIEVGAATTVTSVVKSLPAAAEHRLLHDEQERLADDVDVGGGDDP